MNDDSVLNGLDWQQIVDDMNVSFGIFRFIPPSDEGPSDIRMLYANKAYERELESFGYDLKVLRDVGYVRGGSHLDAQMLHSIKKALNDRVQVCDKLYVSSMDVWVDYYITPMDQENCYYVVLVDIDSDQRHLIEAERLGTTDVLTDTLNRNAFQQARELLEQGEGSLGILLADLNGLKQINDGHGHDAGDEAIAAAARALKDAFPAWDVYRYGGDEFVVLAPDASESAFEEACQAFKDERTAGEPPKLSVGWSWGASSADFNRIMHAADDAMYQAKRAYYKTHDRRR